jgi:glycolate oxidase iron-sulfur subunit
MPPHSQTIQSAGTKSSLEEANRCVACGLCLPSCPTYRKTESEADSPRGRVMLMRGLFDGSLSAGPGLASHLDRCLACRTCEAVCPSGVEYGELIDGARQILAAAGHRPAAAARWLPGVLASSFILDLAGRFRFRARYPAQGAQRGAVSLFLGCVGRLADAETLRAAIFVLTRLGYEVHVPRGQGCCGAMHQHGGDLARAEGLARRNIAAFHVPSPLAGEGGKEGAAARIDAAASPSPGPSHQGRGEAVPILFAASGCGASLVEYGRHGETGRQFAERATDVVSFLAHCPGWEALNIAPLTGTVAVHEPCSARNVLRNASDTYGLLERIPEARVVPLAGNDQCCGAAGLYFLAQPELAARLREDKLLALSSLSPPIVVSTNYGCARWLGAGAAHRGLQVRVLHPVVLLARQLGWRGGVGGLT